MTPQDIEQLDRFAEAALTGMLCNGFRPFFSSSSPYPYVEVAYQIAEQAMRERRAILQKLNPIPNDNTTAAGRQRPLY